MSATQSIPDAAALSSYREMEEEDRRRVVIDNALPSLMIFFPVVFCVGVAEWITRPSHRLAIIVVGGLYASISAIGLFLLRSRPSWAVPIAVGAVSALCAAMLTYSPMVSGGGELCVLAMNVLLGGFAVGFPVGLRNQLLASIVPLVGYAVVLQLGTVTAFPVWYSAAALVSFLFLLALGARAADQHRARILHETFRQRALAAENASLRDQARAADRAKTDILSMVSHELRTPLGSMRILSEMLVDGGIQDRAQLPDLLKRIYDQSKRACDLVETMLEYGSIETGVLRLSVDEFDVGSMLQELRDEVGAVSVRPGVCVYWSFPPDPIVMRSDRGKLEGIIRNLLHNALRHTMAGSVHLQASYDPQRDVVGFSVSDTGEGIALDVLPKIFDRFSRATSSGSGFGLGLYIAQRFSEVLGGHVTVQSNPDIGTRFEVVVPRETLIATAAASSVAAPTSRAA